MGKKHKDRDWDDDRSGNRQSEVSQEDLSEYIHASRPGVWVVTISLLLIFIAVVFWGFMGTLPVTETVTGIVVNTNEYREMYPDSGILTGDVGEIMVYCFVDASRYNGQAIKDMGDNAVMKMPDQTTYTGKIERRFKEPVSKDAARNILFGNEWLADKCVEQDYNWILSIRPDQNVSKYAYTLTEVTLLVEEVPPIRLLLK